MTAAEKQQFKSMQEAIKNLKSEVADLKLKLIPGNVEFIGRAIMMPEEKQREYLFDMLRFFTDSESDHGFKEQTQLIILKLINQLKPKK